MLRYQIRKRIICLALWLVLVLHLNFQVCSTACSEQDGNSRRADGKAKMKMKVAILKRGGGGGGAALPH